MPRSHVFTLKLQVATCAPVAALLVEVDCSRSLVESGALGEPVAAAAAAGGVVAAVAAADADTVAAGAAGSFLAHSHPPPDPCPGHGPVGDGSLLDLALTQHCEADHFMCKRTERKLLLSVTYTAIASMSNMI